MKENKCGFHQKTFRVDEVGKGWAESNPRTALTGLCASLKSLQLWEMDKSLEAMEEMHVLWSCLEIKSTKKNISTFFWCLTKKGKHLRMCHSLNLTLTHECYFYHSQ